MKLLFYSLNFLPRDSGGMEKQLYQIIQGLKKEHDLTLILPSRHNVSLEGVKIYLIPEFFLKSNYKKRNLLISSFMGLIALLFNSFSTIFYVSFVLVKKKYDLVNIYQPSLFATIVLILSKIFRSRATINLRGPEGYLSRFNQCLVDSSLLVSHFIITNAANMIDNYKQKSMLPDFLFRHKRVFYLPNGINIKFWKPCFKKEIENKYDLIFVGNLFDVSHIINKGIKTFYDALTHLKKEKGIDLKVAVLGKYDLPLLKQMISDDIDQYFTFKGFIKNRENLKRQFQEAKVFIMTSYSEGMPNSLMEAMALEMPCIASDVGAIRNLIDHEYNGLLFKTGDNVELSKLIMKILSDQKFQQKLGKNAREKIVDKFNLEEILNKKIQMLYKQIIIEN